MRDVRHFLIEQDHELKAIWRDEAGRRYRDRHLGALVGITDQLRHLVDRLDAFDKGSEDWDE
jgi:hypothetical protein